MPLPSLYCGMSCRRNECSHASRSKVPDLERAAHASMLSLLTAPALRIACILSLHPPAVLVACIKSLACVQSKYVKSKPAADRTGSFVWENAKLVFVVVFSHAEMTVQIKEGAWNPGVGNKEAAAQLRIADFVQRPEKKSVQLRAKGKEVR